MLNLEASNHKYKTTLIYKAELMVEIEKLIIIAGSFNTSLSSR